ncbi:unnamed protein product [Prunus brigantina]
MQIFQIQISFGLDRLVLCLCLLTALSTSYQDEISSLFDSVILEEGSAGFQNSMQTATPVTESECKKGLLASPSTFVTIIGISECTNPSPHPSLSWALARRRNTKTRFQ